MLLLVPFFARSLTLVPCSLLLNRTETLATQARSKLPEGTVELFCGKLLLPYTPSHHSWLHVVNTPWLVAVYLNSTRKGCIIVNQLRKQRRPLVSQSVNAGHRWGGKYYFASRGEQIRGGTHKQLHF